MNEAFVLHEGDAYRCYRRIGATHAQRIGPAWKTPRLAVDYAHALDAARDISPLRPATPRGQHAGAGTPGHDAALTGSPVDVAKARAG